MTKNKQKLIIALKTIVIFFLLGWYLFWLLKPINLTFIDLGRHLKNGEIFVSSFLNLDFDILHNLWKTNFYSFSNSDFPFINHHWGSGVVFYLVYIFSGFKGLHLFYLLLSLLVFLIFYYLAISKGGFRVASTISFFIIPILASRAEIRPEIFSYLFVGLFILILDLYQTKKISSRWLFVLPIIGLFWVNLHIYFFLAPFLISLWLIYDFYIADNSKSKKLLFILGVTLFSLLINPFGLKILLYPFLIFENYGYRVMENQTVLFLYNLNVFTPYIYLFFNTSKVTFSQPYTVFFLCVFRRNILWSRGFSCS